jgi:NTP pyrophosphatase (non-canonical NTP hydrolase)
VTDSLRVLQQKVLRFRDEREWKPFHRPKDLALALGIEAGELGELFLWKSEEQVRGQLDEPAFRERVEEEMADVLLYLLLLAEEAGVDLGAAADAKIAKNGDKYPVSEARGNAAKYTEFGLGQ